MRKSLIYLRATDRYEFWRKNEIAVDQRQFNVKFQKTYDIGNGSHSVPSKSRVLSGKFQATIDI